MEELSSHVQDGPSQPNEGPTEAGKKTRQQQQPADCYTTDKWNFGHLFPMKTAAVVGEKDVTQTPSPPHEQPQLAHGERHQPWDSWWPTPQEAAMLLEAYRTVHSPLFPFALVPAHMSSLELRQHRPFLWKAVMMVGCFLDGARQVKLGRELLGEIGQAAVVDGARNLDLLQGLQMLLAWWVVFTAVPLVLLDVLFADVLQVSLCPQGLSGDQPAVPCKGHVCQLGFQG